MRNPSAVGLTDMSDLANPNPVPAPGSELIGSADFSLPKLAGLDVVTYRGAFDPAAPMSQQWTANWTNFDPQNANYEVLGVTGVEEEMLFPKFRPGSSLTRTTRTRSTPRPASATRSRTASA